jgi:ABC-type Na+ efflux pump permease subunit
MAGGLGLNPAHQVYWKELRLWIYPAGSISRQFLLQVLPAVLFLVVFVFFFVSQGEGFEHGPYIPLIAALTGGSFGAALALDSFAGERERRTLETVLATPLTPRQLLWGKMLAQATVSAGGILVMGFVWLLVVLVVAPNALTRLVVLVSFPAIVVGGSIFALNLILIGNLASLRSPTVKAAGPRFMTYMLIGMGTVFAGQVGGVLLASGLAVAGGRPEFLAVGLIGGTVLALAGLAVYSIYLIRAVLNETRPERFRIEI